MQGLELRGVNSVCSGQSLRDTAQTGWIAIGRRHPPAHWPHMLYAHWRVQRWAQGWGSGAVRPETCNRQGNLQGMGGAPWGKAKRLVPSGVSDPVAICPASLPHTSIKSMLRALNKCDTKGIRVSPQACTLHSQ